LKATCLILPSIKEPWGLVVNEALAYGCPVIVSEYCGCTPEMVIEGVTGYKFNPLDVNSLLESIYKIIEKTQLGYDIHEECVNHAKKFTPEMASHQLYIGFQKYL
jgi:glycosyltransferase involved in cell wall biosynthesis